MTSRKVQYQGLSLPMILINEVKNHIQKYKKYTSVTDFFKQSARDRMRLDVVGNEIPGYNFIEEKIKNYKKKEKKEEIKMQALTMVPELQKTIIDLQKEIINMKKKEK